MGVAKRFCCGGQGGNPPIRGHWAPRMAVGGVVLPANCTIKCTKLVRALCIFARTLDVGTVVCVLPPLGAPDQNTNHNIFSG